ncbi:hypothetical protein AB0C98_41995 [Streptomyces sp. NPDC048558]|uniref:hypothetical protein n=1 Tax=Streptomyces sp. NPDC048558 TaxID=3155759 RepID=UPI0034128E94
MKDGSKRNDQEGHTEGRLARIRRRLSEWQIRQHVARGMAYGVGSGAVSLLVLWVQTR